MRVAIAATPVVVHAQGGGVALGVANFSGNVGGRKIQSAAGVVVQVVGLAFGIELAFKGFDHTAKAGRGKSLTDAQACGQPVGHLRLACGIGSGQPGQQQQIPQRHRRAAFAGGRDSQQAGDLDPAPVGHRDGLGSQVLAQFAQQRQDGSGQMDAPCVTDQMRQRRRIQFQRVIGGLPCLALVHLQQDGKPFGADGGHRQAQQEAVKKGIGNLVFRYLVGGSEHADQRTLHAARAVVELPLVEQGQQGVQDGTVGLEYFVDKRDSGRGQKAIGVAFIAVFLKRLDG